MALESGTRVGIYEVTAKIGEGGMGEVYQARDTTLDRDVALKVLPEAFTADPDRLARFQREAKVLASLNHPNIGGIYGLESAEDTQALVLELIEGPTLADRIAEGPIPVDEALEIAKQIADALEAAHEQGIIHRDLKPANVKVKADGTVKVLDFGLAKAATSEATGASATTSATMSITDATQMGMVIGTAAYMAPEQAKGKPVDKRADIWAFGVVLFEMLTGKRTFSGEDVSDTLAAVLRDQVRFDRLPNETPARVRQVVRACLQRDQKQRIHDVADVRLALEGIFETTVTAPAETAAVVPRQLWQRPVPALLAVMGAVVLGGLVVVGVMWPASSPAPDLIQFAITTPEGAPLGFSRFNQDIAISRDGTHIVYNGRAATGGPQLNLRHMDQLVGAPLRGGEGGLAPFVSPDGEWIGFIDSASRTVLQKVSIFGGPPVTLTESPAPINGASWGTDDQIIFGTFQNGLFRVSGGGGEPEVLTTLDSEQGETSHAWPVIIPGREAVVFMIAAGATRQLAVLELATGEVAQLGLAGSSPHYVSTGHLVYAAEDGSIRAVSFDAMALEVTGNPVPLVEGVAVKTAGGANFSISDNGRLVYALGAGGGGGQSSLVWVDREGREDPLGLPLENYYWPRVSSDGTRVAVSMNDPDNEDVWVSELVRGTLTNLTTDAARDNLPLWVPDGERVVFTSGRENNRLAFFWKLADGTGPVEQLLMGETSGFFRPWDWSADGQTLVFGYQGTGGDTGADIGVLAMEGEGRWEPLLQTAAREGSPAISPDGDWIAYTSDQTGRFEVYVERFPELGERRQISIDGGRAPTWSPVGRELFYRRDGDSAMMTVPIDTEPVFTPGRPEVVFEAQYRAGGGVARNYDVAPDGERFLMVKQGGAPTDGVGDLAPEITVVLNWFEELKARVPVP